MCESHSSIMAMCHGMAASDFIIPSDCHILVTWLSGRHVFSGKIKDSISFKLYSQCILKAVQKSESRKLSLLLEVVEVTSQIRWQQINAVSCTGFFLMQPLTWEQLESLHHKIDDIHCSICLSSCADELSNNGRLRNCIRFELCLLCPNCKVFINANPVCYSCLEPDDYTVLTELSDVCWKRLSLFPLHD